MRPRTRGDGVTNFSQVGIFGIVAPACVPVAPAAQGVNRDAEVFGHAGK
jgi:hypothetical protein